MVAGLTAGRPKYAAADATMRAVAGEASTLGALLSALVDRDAEAYGAVVAAYKLPKEPDAAAAARRQAVADATIGATMVPLDTARACARVAELAAVVASQGNPNAVSDAGVAALLAEAATRGAAYNVRINVAALEDPTRGAPLAAEADALVLAVRQTAARATAEVEKKL
jgi:formiminotetrahydrofolate cyclodeaminase